MNQTRLALVLSLALSGSLAATAGTVVVPNSNAATAGNDNSGLPANTFFSIEAQTVVDPDQFPAGPIYITGFALRSAPGMGPLNLTASTTIYLSTSRNYANSTGHSLLSTTFANNTGSDNTMVFSGNNITITAPACAAPGPCPFGTPVAFTTPFVYNPAKGPLLIDQQDTTLGVTSGQIDIQDCNLASCTVAGIDAVPLGSPAATNVSNNGTIMQLFYTTIPTGTTTNVSVNLTLTSVQNTASHLSVIAGSGQVAPLGSATLSMDASAPISNNAISAPFTFTGGLYFSAVDSIGISFTVNNANFTPAGAFSFLGGTITGGTGAYAGATGSISLSFNVASNSSFTATGSGSVTVGGKTTQLTLTNFHGLAGACPTCEVDYNTGPLSGTASPFGNVTATYRTVETNTPPDPTTGALTVNVNATDSFTGYYSVLGLGDTVLTFPVTVSGGTGAFAGATGSFTITLGQDGSGHQTVTGPGTLTTPTPGTPIITSVKTAFGATEVAYNTWLQINGTNLTPPNTPSAGVVWSNAPEFAQGKMPTNLGPTSTTVNGNLGYIFFYCSAATDTACTAGDQINVLTSLDTTLESRYPVEVVVTNNGVPSAPFLVEKSTFSPTFPLFDSVGHVVARHATDFSLLGPASLFGGGVATPAKIGETAVLVLYGLGPPKGTAPTEGAASQSGSLPALPQCWISGVPVTSIAVALISPGLYQLNIGIPTGTPSGDNAITCSYQGYPTFPGALIAVQ